MPSQPPVADPVTFDVPARAEYVGLLRMLVAALAADRRDLDDDRLDDLRLAVSEACGLVVDAADRDARLTVVCREEPDALVLDVHDGRDTELAAHLVAGGGLPAPEHLDEDRGVPLELIRALVDDVTLMGTGRARDGIRLRVGCLPAQP